MAKGRKRKVQSKSVSAQSLRQLFNSGDYWGQAARGELFIKVCADRHPSLPRAHVPTCTRSQILSYHDHQGKKIAIVHQYLLKDGSLGASGRPDPKYLEHDGIRYSEH